MLACALDQNYKVLGSARKSTQGSQGVQKGLERITATIQEVIQSAGLDPAQLQGIAMGCPGTVNSTKGILITAPNLGWTNTPIGAHLKKKFKVPVMLLNDVDAGTYGEYTHGSGVGARSLLGVFPGTGLGAGFVYDGKILQGRAVSCMELGNIYIPGLHLNSALPGFTILEDLTSRLGMAAASSVECYRGASPQLDTKTNASLREMKSKALSSSYQAGEGTQMIVDNSIQFLGMGIAIVINLMGPDHITLGGGLVEEMPKVYLERLKAEVAKFTIPELLQGTKFSVAKLGGNAVAFGSVAWLRNHPL